MTGLKKQFLRQWCIPSKFWLSKLQSVIKTKSQVRKTPSCLPQISFRIILKSLTTRWTPWSVPALTMCSLPPWGATVFIDSFFFFFLVLWRFKWIVTNFDSPFWLAGITPIHSWLKASQRRGRSPHHGRKGSLGNWDCQQKLLGHCNTKMLFTHNSDVTSETTTSLNVKTATQTPL